MFGLILKLFAPTMWLTQVFVDCNRFDKSKINEVHIEWTLKVYRCTDKTSTKSTDTTLITPASIHTNKTKHQDKV